MSQAQTDADIKDTGVSVEPEDVINDILPFCAQGQTGRDLLSQADYAQDMQRNIGHQPGIARAQLANKQARQAAHMVAGLAQFLSRRYAPGVMDDGNLDKVEAALVAAIGAIINSPAHLATLLKAGLVQPDGVTIAVDEEGLLSALGGNLLLNSEMMLTESGTWEAPMTGWYDVTLIAGGNGGRYRSSVGTGIGGASGEVVKKLMFFSEGDKVSHTIGAGGLHSISDSDAVSKGGDTVFGTVTAHAMGGTPEAIVLSVTRTEGGAGVVTIAGRGYGGGSATWGGEATDGYHFADCDGLHYGAGGGLSVEIRGSTSNITAGGIGDGAPGVVILRWHDPANAGGPLPEPALFAARRMACTADTPVTVNLYDPETGQGSVWREDDAEAKLAEGMISEEAWLAICAQRAAEARAAWLSDPDTEGERFTMLRAARDARLAATDYLVAPDYPLAEAQRAAVLAYRQDLRDLPAQAGAPWDGGGELTPWPEMPAISTSEDA